MSSSDGTGFLDRAEGSSPTDALMKTITAPLLAIAAGVAGLAYDAIGAIANVTEVISAGWTFLVALITEPITILEISAEYTAAATEEFGIFAFGVGVFAIVVGFYVWEISDLGIPIVDEIVPWRD